MKRIFIYVTLVAAMFVSFSSCNGGKKQSSTAVDTTAVATDTAKTDTVAAKADTTTQDSDKNVKAEVAKANKIDRLLALYERKVKVSEMALTKAFNGKITEDVLNSASKKCEAASLLSYKLNTKKKSMTSAQKKKFLKLESRMRDLVNGMNDLAREQLQNSWQE